MKSFTVLKGIAAPMDRANVDTDLIIPKQFLKSIQRSGFGPYLFDEVRYMDQGEPGQDCTNRPLNPDFALNQTRYKGASVLFTRENFGCGSSREHAPWALEDYGIHCIIAPSFADIFYNNCFKNGILPIELDAAIVDRLFAELYAGEGYNEQYEVTVDLSKQTIQTPSGEIIPFEVDEFRKHCLLNGLDDIALTLESADAIRSYEQSWRKQSPWLFDVIGSNT